MAMKLVKKTDDYSIFQRGDNRYAVKDANKKPINGLDKATILLEEELIKVTLPDPAAVEATEQAAEAAAPEADAAAEEAPAEEPQAEAVGDEGDAPAQENTEDKEGEEEAN